MPRRATTLFGTIIVLTLLSAAATFLSHLEFVAVLAPGAPPHTTAHPPSRTADSSFSPAARGASSESKDAAAATATSVLRRRALSSTHFANGAANRSPPRARQPLRAADGRSGAGDLGNSGDVGAACWDQRGAPRWAPAWAAGLLALLAPSPELYAAVQNASVGDRWTILVGWVPQRFMGPQPPGRKANGDVFDAPTRGRDPQFYLREYNASWHSVVKSGGLEHHFQLVHRNALAVCIRERLHISQMFCSLGRGRSVSSSVAPLQIFFCPCRKCREAADATAAAPAHPLRVAHPSFVIPRWHPVTWENRGVRRRGARAAAAAAAGPLPVPELKSHVAGAGSDAPCIPAAAAPWLVSRHDVFAFDYEGLHGDIDALLRTQADAEKSVIVSIFNEFWVDHLHNFVFSMVTRAGLRNYIVATMDDAALALCIANRLPCFDAGEYAEPEVVVLDSERGFVRKVTEELSWIKPRLAVAVLERGYNILMADLDMSWGSSPMGHLNLEGSPDIVHQCDTPAKFSINSGFYFARSNPRTAQFFHNLQVFRPSENSDQTAMKLFARYDHTHGATNECLDRHVFNMKCNYKVANSVRVIKGVETFQWRPFNTNRSTFSWAILHATCLSGAQAKLVYLRTVDAWFLDDLDNKTAAPDACLALDAPARVVPARGAVTTHSPRYMRSIDRRFLEERH